MSLEIWQSQLTDSTVHGEIGQCVQQHVEEENRLEQGSVTTLPLHTVVKIVLEMQKKLKSATNTFAQVFH